MKRLYILLLAATLASACARTRAKTAPDNPPLDMPPPPAHDLESSDENPPEPVGLPSEPARTTPMPRPTQVPQTRTDTPRSEPRQETPAPEPPKPAAAEEPARPPALQTTPAEAEPELEKQIRAVMARAQHDLNRIDYRSLNQEARDQYEYAKSFIRQADDAIRVKNLPFAKSVADKAATLAAQLAGRR
jgi:hypothetical protein